MKTVTVAEFNSGSDAEPLHRRLVAAGIRAVLCNRSRPEKTLTFFRPSAGVRIEVPRDEFETAFRLVYDWNSEQKTEGTEIPLPNQKSGTKDTSENPWQRP